MTKKKENGSPQNEASATTSPIMSKARKRVAVVVRAPAPSGKAAKRHASATPTSLADQIRAFVTPPAIKKAPTKRVKTTAKPRADHRPIRDEVDAMRSIAWFHEFIAASGLTTDDLIRTARDKPTQNRTGGGDLDKDAKQCEILAKSWRWDLYLTCARAPLPSTISFIDQRFASAHVFTHGPDDYPLWSILASPTSTREWMTAIDQWLTPGVEARVDHPDKIKQMAKLSRPFHAKVAMAWNLLVPESARKFVDFLDFSRGDQPNAISRPMYDFLATEDWVARKAERRSAAAPLGTGIPATAAELANLAAMREEALAKIDLGTVVGVLALWRLAEEKQECRSEARYLALGILPWVPFVLADWGIGTMVLAYLQERIMPPDVTLDLYLDEAIRNPANQPLIEKQAILHGIVAYLRENPSSVPPNVMESFIAAVLRFANEEPVVDTTDFFIAVSRTTPVPGTDRPEG